MRRCLVYLACHAFLICLACTPSKHIHTEYHPLPSTSRSVDEHSVDHELYSILQTKTWPEAGAKLRAYLAPHLDKDGSLILMDSIDARYLPVAARELQRVEYVLGNIEAGDRLEKAAASIQFESYR